MDSSPVFYDPNQNVVIERCHDIQKQFKNYVIIMAINLVCYNCLLFCTDPYLLTRRRIGYSILVIVGLWSFGFCVYIYFEMKKIMKHLKPVPIQLKNMRNNEKPMQNIKSRDMTTWQYKDQFRLPIHQNKGENVEDGDGGELAKFWRGLQKSADEEVSTIVKCLRGKKEIICTGQHLE
ncbi:uncharacterized protein LOC118438342 isoform X2 [Folsomia candida]|uniref:uncharacterized protein LOC118438342 isoform X2 n=1 Tax=Folsomia candida TaxID=158441 RepID=UPI001604A2F5|nr:uncharacterized protein LOC118438342 isoform X2 [Folsomia candida]